MNVRSIEIVSNLKTSEGNSLFDLEHFRQVLREKDCIKEYAYIIHDKDKYTDNDEAKNPNHKEGELVPAHIHALLRFTCPQDTKYIAMWFQIEENFLQKTHGWLNAVRYLTHLNAPEKYQYDLDDVFSNFNVKSLLDNADRTKQLNMVLDDILSGKICEYNKTLKIDHKMLVKHAKPINEAFKVRQEYLLATVKERNTNIIFIYGESGTGKTTFAKMIAKHKNLTYFQSGDDNDILEKYKQEPIVLLDEIRPNSMSLVSFLKLTDPHSVSASRSRYHNKVLYCNFIIITTPMDIDTFFSKMLKDDDESIIQVKRRCTTYIYMTKQHIFVSQWDKKLEKYTRPIAYDNTVITGFLPEKELSEPDVETNISELIPFLKKSEDTDNSFQNINEMFFEQMEIPFD